jgi:PAS domain S-box-containing protein
LPAAQSTASATAAVAAPGLLTLDDLAMAAFDAVPSEAALIDPIGVIRYVNRAWRDFARTNDGAADFYVGKNYFTVLSHVREPMDQLAASIAQGVRAVLTGLADEYASPDHRCHRPIPLAGRTAPTLDAVEGNETANLHTMLERRWFRMIARPLSLREGSNRLDAASPGTAPDAKGAARRWVLLVYENVTDAHLPRYMSATEAPAGAIPAAPSGAPAATEPERRPTWSADNAAFLRSILDDIADIVVTTDADGRIQSFNRAAETAFGLSAATVLGGDVALLMGEEEAAQQDFYLQRYRETGASHMLGIPRQMPARRADGTTFWVELRTTECWFEGRRLFVSTMRDLSERRRMESDLRQAKQAAEASNRAKSEFLARMSHELRTPLNSILGFAEVIKGQLFGDDPVRYAEYAQHIYDGGSWLLSLINDILDLSKIEAGRLDLKIARQAPTPLVEASIDIVSAQLSRKNLHLIRDLPAALPPIDIDARAFQQILINLLSNAVKFTPDGGQIRIGSHVFDSGAGQELCLTISDTGIGIPADKIDRVLEPFGHSDSGMGAITLGDPGAARAGGELPGSQKGTGLGLSICRRLMELQHGKLSLASQPGQGTAVTISFPLPPAAASGGVPSGPAPSGPAPSGPAPSGAAP